MEALYALNSPPVVSFNSGLRAQGFKALGFGALGFKWCRVGGFRVLVFWVLPSVLRFEGFGFRI